MSPGPVPDGRPVVPARRVWRWLPWIGLVVVVAVALAVGVQRHSPTPTLGQRTMSIAGQVKCPVCAGETAAESDTVQATAVRTFIRQQLTAGASRSTIISELTASYGSVELESPPAHGIDLVLWVVPPVAFVVAVGGLYLLFRRWRPARIDAVSEDDRRLVGTLMAEPPPTGPPRSPAPAPAAPGGPV